MLGIYEILEAIAATSKRTEKISLLKEHDSVLLRTVVKYAYCPLTKYYIKTIPEYTCEADDSKYYLDEAIRMLEPLSSREITGNNAKFYLANLLSNLVPQDASVLSRIVLKDLKIGCNISAFNSAFGKGLIKETHYMGAKSYSEKAARELFSKNSWLYSEVKMDGRYSNAIILEDSVEMESRQSQPTNFGRAFNNLTSLYSFFGEEVALNGELIIKGVDRYTSNGYISSLVSIGNKALEGVPYVKDVKKLEKASGKTVLELLNSITYVIWDYLPLENYLEGTWGTSREERLDKLEEIDYSLFPNLELIEYEKVKSLGEAIDHNVRLIARGEEGTIVKAPHSIWVSGKPKEQLKIKLEMTSDMVITGYKMGNPGTRIEHTIGAVLCESSCGEVKCSASSMSDDIREELLNNQEKYLGTVVEVKSCGLSSNKEGKYALLHPSVVRLRDDTTADSLEKIKADMEMSKSAKKNNKSKRAT